MTTTIRQEYEDWHSRHASGLADRTIAAASSPTRTFPGLQFGWQVVTTDGGAECFATKMEADLWYADHAVRAVPGGYATLRAIPHPTDGLLTDTWVVTGDGSPFRTIAQADAARTAVSEDADDITPYLAAEAA